MTKLKEMSRDSVIQTRLRDPLSEVTRKERRNLLAVSVIGIVIDKIGLVPTKITALGIEFSQSDKSGLLAVLAVIIFYFLLAFLIYCISDLAAWAAAERESELVKHESEISELAELDDMERERYARAELEDEIPIEIGKEPPKKYDYYFTVPVREGKLISRVRAVFDFLIPIAIGLYAFFVLI